MIYDPASRRIMLFGAQTIGTIDTVNGLIKEGDRLNDIWTYSLTVGEWKLHPTKLPHTGERDGFLAFDSIVFVLYCEDNEHSIWCLELMTGKFIKSEWNFP